MIYAFYKDNYLKELDAKVIEANGKFIVLNDTIFYPNGGGQLNDTGKIICKNETYSVVFVKKFAKRSR